MINLHEYIKNYRYSHPSFQGSGDGIVSDFFRRNSDLSNVIEICTTEVYPQCLKIDGKENLVWDNTYWMLYKRFLFGVWRFSPQQTSIDDLSDFLESFQYLFLSLKLSKLPEYSYYFATQYHKLNRLIPNFQKTSYSKEERSLFGEQLYKQVNEFAQWQVFLHELHHYSYRQNSAKFQHESEIVRSIFKQYHAVLSQIPEDDPRNYDGFWNTYAYYANSENPTVIEDICCDIFAIVDFVNDFISKYSNNDNQSKEEMFLGYVSTIRYVVEMQRLFTHAEGRWTQVIQMFNDMPNNKLNKEHYQSNHDKLMCVIRSRAGVVYSIAAHILGINYTEIMQNNELFDSDYYTNALEKSLSDAYDSDSLGFVYVYLKTMAEKFSPMQFRSARDLLIGWY